MTNHGASQAPPPAVSVTESRTSFGGATVLDGVDRPGPVVRMAGSVPDLFVDPARARDPQA